MTMSQSEDASNALSYHAKRRYAKTDILPSIDGDGVGTLCSDKLEDENPISSHQ